MSDIDSVESDEPIRTVKKSKPGIFNDVKKLKSVFKTVVNSGKQLAATSFAHSVAKGAIGLMMGPQSGIASIAVNVAAGAIAKTTTGSIIPYFKRKSSKNNNTYNMNNDYLLCINYVVDNIKCILCSDIELERSTMQSLHPLPSIIDLDNFDDIDDQGIIRMGSKTSQIIRKMFDVPDKLRKYCNCKTRYHIDHCQIINICCKLDNTNGNDE
jgi:hypothetical protein